MGTMSVHLLAQVQECFVTKSKNTKYFAYMLLLLAERTWEMFIIQKGKLPYLSFFPEPFLQLGI